MSSFPPPAPSVATGRHLPGVPPPPRPPPRPQGVHGRRRASSASRSSPCRCPTLPLTALSPPFAVFDRPFTVFPPPLGRRCALYCQSMRSLAWVPITRPHSIADAVGRSNQPASSRVPYRCATIRPSVASSSAQGDTARRACSRPGWRATVVHRLCAGPPGASAWCTDRLPASRGGHQRRLFRSWCPPRSRKRAIARWRRAWIWWRRAWIATRGMQRPPGPRSSELQRWKGAAEIRVGCRLSRLSAARFWCVGQGWACWLLQRREEVCGTLGRSHSRSGHREQPWPQHSPLQH